MRASDKLSVFASNDSYSINYLRSCFTQSGFSGKPITEWLLTFCIILCSSFSDGNASDGQMTTLLLSVCKRMFSWRFELTFRLLQKLTFKHPGGEKKVVLDGKLIDRHQKVNENLLKKRITIPLFYSNNVWNTWLQLPAVTVSSV